MSAIPVIAIFDVGKTNKKLFLFDEQYKIVFERSARFEETVDDDGYPCEDLENLRTFVYDSLQEIFKNNDFDVKAINASGYGASFVHVDENGTPATPLYNYLKPYPEELKSQFYDNYGGQEKISHETASPVLGHLNSGMQIYWLKHHKPVLYDKIRYSLHLPQYLSYLVSGKFYSDITSIGCHTYLWDFNKHDYHAWVYAEGINEKLPPIVPGDHVVPATFGDATFHAGVGLHDSSAALIPYLVNFDEPFILISTGTWCISLNPFNNVPLTSVELECDCLAYLTYQHKPVKASRLFAGNEHEQQVKKLAVHFNKHETYYTSVEFDVSLINTLRGRDDLNNISRDIKKLISESSFVKHQLSNFASYEEAYHQLIIDIINQQVASTTLVLNGTTVKKIFVDGGFSKNSIYMNLLASAFPTMEVFAASMAQATAVGTALAIHYSWNINRLPNDIIELKHYSVSKDLLF